MLLRNYRKEIFRPACNTRFQSLHCIAHLDQDVSAVFPYLNSRLGAFQYLKDPPALTLKVHGKLITLHAREIAINALKDPEEADKLLEWLKAEINDTWRDRQQIEPKHDVLQKPKVFDILKMLPKTNCRECHQPTCTVFATLVVEGVKGAGDCPGMDHQEKNELKAYLGQFNFDL